jgi:prepilin-type N-terminal cleavage/methylation domain-containing protein
MLTRIRRVVRAEQSTADQGGFTLIELLVSMGIFSVVLVIFMAAVSSMTKVTVRVDNTQAGQAELSRAFSRLDHSLRYADSVNYPVKSGSGNWYLEYRTSATSTAAAPVCTQYQLNSTADTLAYRTWTDGDLATVTGWNVTASRVVNKPNVAAEQPFTMTPAGGAYRHQAVGIKLLTQTSQSPPVQTLDTTIVAVNSSGDSPSNEPTSTTPVTSKHPVCTGITEP